MSRVVKILSKVNTEFARSVVQYIHKDEYFFAYTKNLTRLLMGPHAYWAEINLKGLEIESFLHRLNDDPYSSTPTREAHEEALDQVYEAHLRI